MATASPQLHAPNSSPDVTRIDGNIDPSSGNVDVPGHVHVRGNVADLFQLKSGGDALIEGVVEAATLTIGRDLSANGGISGKSRGQCRVHRNLLARYIMQGTVECAGDIVVQTEVSNSRIIGGGNLKIDNGPLVGGQIIVAGSIECVSIGSQSGAATTISVGVDEQFRRLAESSLPKIERLRRDSEQIRTALAPLLKIQKNLSAGQKEKVTEMLFEADGLDAEAGELLAILRQGLQKLTSRPEPEIRITGTIFPGTTIRIAKIQTMIDIAIKGPVRLVARTIDGQHYIALIEDTGPGIYPLPSHAHPDPVMDSLMHSAGHGA